MTGLRPHCLSHAGTRVNRVAILGGGGAMGGLFGAWLAAKGGAEVTLIDVSPTAIETISRDGLAIEEKDGATLEVALPVTADPATVGPVDLVINFVKCYHTEAAVRAAEPMIGPETVVLTLQNGWGNADRIAGVVGAERVVVGLTYHSATLLGPGRVKHPGLGRTVVGELDGRKSDRVAAIVALFNRRGARGRAERAGAGRDLEEAVAQLLHAADRRAARGSSPTSSSSTTGRWR